MIQITKIWFEGDWIYGEDTNGKQYKQSILWYWRLVDATPEQRNQYELSYDGIHWHEINEDIGMDSFEERNNVVPTKLQDFFLRNRYLNIAATARYMHISPTLLRDYIYGWKVPSKERVLQIQNGLHAMGNQLKDITIAK